MPTCDAPLRHAQLSSHHCASLQYHPLWTRDLASPDGMQSSQFMVSYQLMLSPWEVCGDFEWPISRGPAHADPSPNRTANLNLNRNRIPNLNPNRSATCTCHYTTNVCHIHVTRDGCVWPYAPMAPYPLPHISFHVPMKCHECYDMRYDIVCIAKLHACAMPECVCVL